MRSRRLFPLLLFHTKHFSGIRVNHFPGIHTKKHIPAFVQQQFSRRSVEMTGSEKILHIPVPRLVNGVIQRKDPERGSGSYCQCLIPVLNVQEQSEDIIRIVIQFVLFHKTPDLSGTQLEDKTEGERKPAAFQDLYAEGSDIPPVHQRFPVCLWVRGFVRDSVI